MLRDGAGWTGEITQRFVQWLTWCDGTTQADVQWKRERKNKRNVDVTFPCGHPEESFVIPVAHDDTRIVTLTGLMIVRVRVWQVITLRDESRPSLFAISQKKKKNKLKVRKPRHLSVSVFVNGFLRIQRETEAGFFVRSVWLGLQLINLMLMLMYWIEPWECRQH